MKALYAAAANLMYSRLLIVLATEVCILTFHSRLAELLINYSLRMWKMPLHLHVLQQCFGVCHYVLANLRTFQL